MITYEPLWNTMQEKGVTTYQMIHRHKINQRTIHNLKHNKNVTLLTVEKLCSILECGITDVVEFVDK